MGVKSTVLLTRLEAELRLIQEWRDYYEAMIAGGIASMSNQEIEDLLEGLNDAKYEHGGFDNYAIADEDEVDRHRRIMG